MHKCTSLFVDASLIFSIAWVLFAHFVALQSQTAQASFATDFKFEKKNPPKIMMQVLLVESRAAEITL